MSPRIRQATLADHNTITTFNLQIASVRPSLRACQCAVCLHHRACFILGAWALQETEDLKLDTTTASHGVAALLRDPTKGRYFVLEARPQCNFRSGCQEMNGALTTLLRHQIDGRIPHHLSCNQS